MFAMQMPCMYIGKVHPNFQQLLPIQIDKPISVVPTEIFQRITVHQDWHLSIPWRTLRGGTAYEC